MPKFKKIETTIPGVYIVEPTVYKDERGFFFESWNQKEFRELGLETNFVQENQSSSTYGTLRGLHYQLPHGQTKLCRVLNGAVLDVAVDIRQESPTFGQHISVVLSRDNRRQLYIPKGMAHGFITLSKHAEFLYKCDDFWHPECEKGIIWNDPSLNIIWGHFYSPTLKNKDRGYPTLKQALKQNLLP